MLHGGKSTKERFLELQKFLIANGFPSFAFDFEGIGESEGKLDDGSLINRLENARAGFDVFSEYIRNIAVLGFSMGGHIASRLTETRNVYPLILLAPAAYGEEAESKSMNESFTKIIRTKNSWQNSPVFTSLNNYKGKVLVIYGENDIVVPWEVQQRYKNHIAKKGKFMQLKNATHWILSPKNKHEEESKKIAFTEILSLMEYQN